MTLYPQITVDSVLADIHTLIESNYKDAPNIEKLCFARAYIIGRMQNMPRTAKTHIQNDMKQDALFDMSYMETCFKAINAYAVEILK